jgi:predicted secreted hydrolase
MRMSKREGLTPWLVGVGVVGTVLGGTAWWVARPAGPGGVRATLSVSEALGGQDVAGFARALAPRVFAFPADHGPHLEYRTEWWYYTGNVGTADGRAFGFQLTFFRFALVPGARPRASAWGTTQVYLAHFAVTDVAGARFHAADRMSRGALGLAGATAAPFRVWLEDWAAAGGAPDAFPLRLRAATDAVAIDLVLTSAKPPVLQGERGLSRKSAEPGNASYYYSLTRLPARGTIRIGGTAFTVQGLAWMDREWSTSALAPDQVGWDWFALQLDDRREVMLYRLRRRDGSIEPVSAGSLVEADGAARSLSAAVMPVEVTGHWTSPRSGARYPAGWRLAIPGADLALDITPRLADQELDLGLRYWEGAVRVRGTAAGRPVSGSGYVELTGY